MLFAMLIFFLPSGNASRSTVVSRKRKPHGFRNIPRESYAYPDNAYLAATNNVFENAVQIHKSFLITSDLNTRIIQRSNSSSHSDCLAQAAFSSRGIQTTVVSSSPRAFLVISW
ncbi:hypothetical protein F4680DRAFT_404212 [Xylaria scruposa]|nr:hypothetical protein F4680DRAFT_404212 [Xylaria scruposa]